MQHAALSTRQEINGQDKPGAGVMDGARKRHIYDSSSDSISGIFLIDGCTSCRVRWQKKHCEYGAFLETRQGKERKKVSAETRYFNLADVVASEVL